MAPLSTVARLIRTSISITLLLVAMASARAQVFNCYEGLGTLENNWNNWSWCSVNFQSSAYVYEGWSSIQVTYTGAWQGFAIESPTSFPAGNFSALTLALNGGSIAGRSINISLTVNGNATSSLNLNAYIPGGIAKNSWRLATVPLSAFKLKPTDQISAVWLQESTGKAQPTFWIGKIGWVASPMPPFVNVDLIVSNSSRIVDQKMFGVNTAVWDNAFTSTACTNLIAKGGYKAFRFPGGSLSDGYHWQTNTTDSNTWTWATNFDAWASVAVPATKGQCFITANYGSGTPAEAAAWVAYSNVSKHYGMKFWEIGNEVYGSWEEDHHAKVNDPVTYAQQFAQYYHQMKAVDPTIKIGAVASAGEDSYANYPSEAVTNPRTHATHAGWTPVMLATLSKLGVTPDFLSYHLYPEYNVDCDFTLLVGNGVWATDMANLRQQLSDYLGSSGAQTQLMCTENNADAGTPGKQLCSLVNGLYAADSFGSLLQTECNSYVWWDLLNGSGTNLSDGPWLYGWRPYGDEGTVSTDFTQTYPVYYMEQLFNLFAAAGDQVMSTVTSYNLLSAYSTKRSDGTLRLMVINKNPTSSAVVPLHLTGYKPKNSVLSYSYGINEDNLAKNGQVQRLSTNTLTITPAAPTFSFPPYSVTVLVFSPGTTVIKAAPL